MLKKQPVTQTELKKMNEEGKPWRTGGTIVPINKRMTQYMRSNPEECKDSTMYYANAKDVKKTETEMLQACKCKGTGEGCDLNKHERSNLPEKTEGIVYSIVKDNNMK